MSLPANVQYVGCDGVEGEGENCGRGKIYLERNALHMKLSSQRGAAAARQRAAPTRWLTPGGEEGACQAILFDRSPATIKEETLAPHPASSEQALDK